MYMYMRIYEDVHMCIFMVIATCSALETRYIHDVCFESRVFYWKLMVGIPRTRGWINPGNSIDRNSSFAPTVCRGLVLQPCCMADFRNSSTSEDTINHGHYSATPPHNPRRSYSSTTPPCTCDGSPEPTLRHKKCCLSPWFHRLIAALVVVTSASRLAVGYTAARGFLIHNLDKDTDFLRRHRAP